MLPDTFEAWVFILGTCFISFLIGRRLKARRNKAEKNNNAYLNSLKRMALAETRGRTKKDRRKTRKAKKQTGE